MQLLLHLGMQKTGSKAIQTTVANNESLFRGAGLIRCRAYLQGLWHQPIMTAKADQVRTELAREGASGAEAARLISYELLYTANDDVIDAVVGAGEVRALLLLRHPVEWLDSFLNQLVKAHRTTFEDLVSFDAAQGPSADHADVVRHAGRWIRHLDEGALTVRLYDRSENALEPFLEWLGLGLGMDDLVLESRDPNPRADLDGLKTLIAVKRLLRGRPTALLAQAVEQVHAAYRGRWQDTSGAPPFTLVDPSDHGEVLAARERATAELLGLAALPPPRTAARVVSMSELLGYDAAAEARARRILGTG